MKYFITLLLIISKLSSYAQKSESFLIGNWKVVDVLLDKGANTEDKKVLEIVKPVMLKTTILFQTNHKGIYKITGFVVKSGSLPSSDIYWTYNPENQRLSIQEWNDRRGFIAEYIVKTENEDVFFKLTDGPVILKVKKVHEDVLNKLN